MLKNGRAAPVKNGVLPEYLFAVFLQGLPAAAIHKLFLRLSCPPLAGVGGGR
ncbi:MAG: hypothetical protein ABSD50_15645 [Smithella sp.]|jgi:hypothetical protein